MQKFLDYLYKNKISFLEEVLTSFVNESLVIPKVGIELEFYLTNQNSLPLDDHSSSDNFIAELSMAIPQNSLIYKIEKERGIGQIELKTTFDADLLKVCDEVEKIKLVADNIALKQNLITSYAAQPFLNDCGSALQFNISLHDKNNKNMFEEEGGLFFNSILGLLERTDPMLILLAPLKEDYIRFDCELNKNLHKSGKYSAPTNLSFGRNNRTTAIRIPSLEGKRIEYRVAAAGADPYLSMAAILNAILFGIKNDLTLDKSGFREISGNAFDDQYELKSFAKNYQDALNKFRAPL